MFIFCVGQMPDNDLHRRRLGQKLDPMNGELYTREVYAPEKPPQPVGVICVISRLSFFYFVCLVYSVVLSGELFAFSSLSTFLCLHIICLYCSALKLF